MVHTGALGVTVGEVKLAHAESPSGEGSGYTWIGPGVVHPCAVGQAHIRSWVWVKHNGSLQLASSGFQALDVVHSGGP
jgi:hypothetical protein